MKVKYIFVLVILMSVLFSSCKTEFERIRASGDPELMVQTADKYFQQENYLQAQTLYEIVIPFYRGKEKAADIFFNYAYTHYFLSEFILANHYFKNFANTYINDEKREEALYMAAYSNYNLSPNFKLDQSYSEVAISDFQLFINTFPNSDKVKEANELIQDMRSKKEVKAFHQGQLYLDIKQYEAAMVSFENMIQEFPDSDLVEEARYKSVIASYDLAKNSIYNKQEERFTSVLERADYFKKKHPRSKYNRELKKIVEDSKKKIKEL